MRLAIAAVGRLKQGAERDLYQRYAERIDKSARAAGLGALTLTEVAEARAGSATARQRAEADALLAKIPGDAVVVALDETGQAVSSAEFAALLKRLRSDGAPTLTFAIGGPDGHGAALLERADRVLSLGPMTLPHGLVRVILAEQIYRALTIMAGHPYHRG